MNKIINFFDYVFYRLYQFFSAHRIFRGMEEIDAISMIFLTIFMPIVVFVLCVFTHNGMRIEKYTMPYYVSLAFVILFGYGPLLQRYMFNKSISKANYKVFKDRWGKENPQQRKKRGWCIVLLIINNVLILPYVLTKLVHYYHYL